jgi:hypothetical protein
MGVSERDEEFLEYGSINDFYISTQINPRPVITENIFDR